MRVLMLSPEYPPHLVGGLGKHVDDLLPELARAGVEVHLITPRENGGAQRERPATGITVHRVDIPRGATGAPLSDTQAMNWRLLEAANEIEVEVGSFDVIHGHEWLVAFAATRLHETWQTPLVATIHATERGRQAGYLPTELSRAINDVETEFCNQAAVTIATSHYMAHELISFFGLPNDKVEVIPNGVNTTAYDRLAGEDLRTFRRRYAADDQLIAFHIGRIVFEKGLQVLVEAAPLILHWVPNLKFVIAGRGPMVDELRLQADRIGVGQSFYFTGFISDDERDRLYKVASLAVFPSLYEPFGIVALEAMAARVPVVVSGVGGLTEVVENHVTGMTAYPDNRESLAWAILHTLQQPEWTAARVENAYRRVIENFTWRPIARQTRAVYERAVRDQSGGSASFDRHQKVGEYDEAGS